MLTQNLPEYWENKYQKGEDKWDIGGPTPGLLEFFKNPLCPKSGRVLVPGAGKGYDAVEWAKKGYDTVAVDFSPSAVASLNAYAEKHPKLSVLSLDLFEMTPKSTEPFDIIFDYGCFAAVHPGRRDEYFEFWDRMLKPSGFIAALFYPIIKTTSLDGPPHPTSEGELLARLDGVLEIKERYSPKKSAKGREGHEQMWILEKVAK